MTSDVTVAGKHALFPAALRVDAETALLDSILALQRAHEEALQAHAVSSRLEAVSTELEVQRAEVRRLSAEIEAVQFSASWRLTAPVRRLSASFPWLGKGLRAVASGLRACLYRGRLDSGAKGVSTNPSPPATLDTIVKPSVSLFREPSTDASIALPLLLAPSLKHDKTRIAAIIHLENADFANEFRRYLDCIEERIDVYISTSNAFHVAQLQFLFEGFSGGKVDVCIVNKSGDEVVSRLTSFKHVYSKYTYILHLHGLRSDAAMEGEPWRQFLLQSLIGDGASAKSILSLMDEAPDLGMVGVQHFEPQRRRLEWDESFVASQSLAMRMGVVLNKSSTFDFPSGSMFWARSAAMAPLLKLQLTVDDFRSVDGSAAVATSQAIERLYYFICEKAGYRWLKVARTEFYAHTPCIDSIYTPVMLREWIDINCFSLLAPDKHNACAESLSVFADATPALITHIQRHASGHCMRPRKLEVEKRVAIGISIRDHSLAQVRRAIDAAKISFSNCREVADTLIYVPRSAVATADLVFQNTAIEVVDDVGVDGYASTHNHMMQIAFSDGATHYVVHAPEGLMHPSAAKVLMRMLMANHDRALVEAIKFPKADLESYGVFDFETPLMSGNCMVVSHEAYELIGGFDERLSNPCAVADLSWRARAAGLSLKMCPQALFLRAPTKHVISCADVAEATQRLRSVIYLARKWGASQEFEHWALEQSRVFPADLASINPAVVPAEWLPYADFSNRACFAEHVGQRND